MYAIDTFYQAVLSWDFYDRSKNPSSWSVTGDKRHVFDEAARMKNVKRQKLDHNGGCKLTGESQSELKSPKIMKKPTKRKWKDDVDSFQENSKKSEKRKKTTFQTHDEYTNYFTKLLFGDIKAKLQGMAGDHFRYKRKENPCSPKESGLSRLSSPDMQSRTLTLGVDKPDQYIPFQLVLLLWGEESATIPREHALGLIRGIAQMTIRVEIALMKNDPRYSEILSYFDQWRTAVVAKGVSGSEKSQKTRILQSEDGPKNKLRFVDMEHIQNRFKEYLSITRLRHHILGDAILNPTRFPNKPSRIWNDLKKEFRDHLQRCLNPSQFNAVVTACSQAGITLLQGPPGTGKTRTVHYLLNAIHVSQIQYRADSIIKKMYQSRRAWSVNSKVDKVFTPENATITTNKRLIVKEQRTIDPSDPMSLDAILQHVGDNMLNQSAVVSVEKRPKILVCAPSNSAVDEIITRMMESNMYDANLREYNPPIVRVGRSPKIRAEAYAKVHLDSRVKAYLDYKYDKKKYPDPTLLDRRIQKVQASMVQISQKSRMVENAMIRDFGSRTADEFKASQILENNYMKCATRLVALKEALVNTRRELQRLMWVKDLPRLSAAAEIKRDHLKEAEIVFATLNTCGGKDLRELGETFSWCIVDEAAQCTEPDILIPLQHMVRSIVLVGDPQQLPPTVFLHGPESLVYERSLFERLQSAGHRVHMLNVQYRMHPDIVSFPNNHFYRAELLNGDNTTSPVYVKEFHKHPDFAPYLYFDVAHSRETRSDTGHSLKNPEEARFVVKHLEDAFKEFPKSMLKLQIGIITPYKEQANEVRRLVLRNNILHNKAIEIATVDFFQGREKDIVMLSCVRASERSIGFVSDIRRMNVGITRAKYSLWIVGNYKSLVGNNDWKSLLNDAEKRQAMRTVHDPRIGALDARTFRPRGRGQLQRYRRCWVMRPRGRGLPGRFINTRGFRGGVNGRTIGFRGQSKGFRLPRGRGFFPRGMFNRRGRVFGRGRFQGRGYKGRGGRGFGFNPLVNDENTLFIQNLTNEVTEEELTKEITKIAPLQRLTIKRRDTYAYAFAVFHNKEQMFATLKVLDGKLLHGKPLSLKVSRKIPRSAAIMTPTPRLNGQESTLPSPKNIDDVEEIDFESLESYDIPCWDEDVGVNFEGSNDEEVALTAESKNDDDSDMDSAFDD